MGDNYTVSNGGGFGIYPLIDKIQKEIKEKDEGVTMVRTGLVGVMRDELIKNKETIEELTKALSLEMAEHDRTREQKDILLKLIGKYHLNLK